MKRNEPVEELSDFDLIQGYLAGNETDFETLYYRHHKRLYGYLNNLLPGRSAEVDDLFQQTWLRVIAQLPKYREQGFFAAWLFRIGHNLMIDRLRRSRKDRLLIELDREDMPEIEAPPGEEPWRMVDEIELKGVIGEALQGLPLEQREVFLLRNDNLPFKEIAEIQQCSINTALARMQYALKNLKNHLRNIDQGGILP